MKQLTLSIISGLVLCSGVAAFAQQQSANAPTTDAKLTPNVTGSNSSIGSIYSPNLFDGSANVTIPIYNFSNDFGAFGVSLGYNTKGVKVDELLGPLGNHWALAAGGSIQRVVKDLPDEVNQGADMDQWFPYSKIRGKYVTYSETPTESADNTVYRDGEHDDFVVSAGTLNFAFNIGKDFYIFTHPKRNVKVTLLLNGSVVNSIPTNSTANNLEFVIRDEGGNNYYFSGGDKEKRELDNGHGASPNPVASFQYTSRWVLTKIEFANGTAITYTYATKNPANFSLLYQSNYARENLGTGVMPSGSNPVRADETAVSMAQLTAISYPNHVTVDFIYDEAGIINRCDEPGISSNEASAVIREIRVSDGNCIRYVMDQSYVVDPVPGVTTTGTEIPYGNSCIGMSNPDYYLYHRLRLKGIHIMSCDGSLSEPYYAFEYDPMLLPARLNGAQDYFGYYNGQQVGNSRQTIPFHTPVLGNASSYGTDKTDNFNYATAGILRKVKNAYGGSVSFAYDAHSLSNKLTGLPTGDPAFFGASANDGIRLLSVTEQDKFLPSSSSYTEYAYEDGQRFLTGGYFHYPTGWINNAPEQVMFNGIYVSQHQFINGSNHGYSKVTMTTKDQNGNPLSKRILTFTNFQDALSNNQPRMQLNGSTKNYYDLPFTDKQYLRDWEIGLPLQTEEYDQLGNILSRSTNYYTPAPDLNSTSGKVENTKVMKADGVVVTTDTYHPYTGREFLNSTTTQKFAADALPVNDTIWYTYDNHDNLETIKTRNSKGEYLYTRNVYNYGASATGASTTLNNMTNMGLEKIVSREIWKQAPGFQYNDRLLTATITADTILGGKILTRKLFNLIADNPILYSDYTGVTQANPSANPYGKVIAAYNNQLPANFEKETEVQQFDIKGNPMETRLLDEEVYKAMIWDTLTGQKLAEASNCRYNDIAYSGFEATTKGNWNYNAADIAVSSAASGGGIDGRYLLRIASTNASPINVSSLTPGKEYIVTFWCKGGTPVLSGAGLGSIPLTVVYAPGNGWSFFQAKFTPASTAVLGLVQAGTGSPFFYYIDDMRLFPAAAQMQSWSYEPLFGASSVSDATGRITYYEYDALGRPVLVRNQEGNILSKTTYHVSQ